MNAAETHETIHWESGMRYQISPFKARSEFRSGLSLPIAARLNLHQHPYLDRWPLSFVKTLGLIRLTLLCESRYLGIVVA
jgi:hypothetical protein